jgi:virginiamycin B lyase
MVTRRGWGAVLAGAALGLGAVPVRAQPAGPAVTITEYPVPTPDSRPGGLVVGPDGALWFIESVGNRIGRLTLGGRLTEFPIPTPAAHLPNQAFVGLGPDGMVWFTESAANKLGRITPAGEITEYPIPSAAAVQDPVLGEVRTSFPIAVAAGADRAVWFNERATNQIGRLTPDGRFAEYPLPEGVGGLVGLAPGPDGALWFTATTPGHVGRVAPDGAMTVHAIPTPESGVLRLKAGPDGAVWFVENQANQVGRATGDGRIVEFPVPATGVGPDIAPGPDGAMWFTVLTDNLLGRVTATGEVTLYPVPTPLSRPYWLVTGADGALWFTEINGNQLGRAQLRRAPGALPRTGGPPAMASGLALPMAEP